MPKTKILKINPKKPEAKKIQAAAEIIQKGGIVAFPTETVYGLGANAFDVKAVQKIFRAKGRPQDNPLIVHIADRNDLAGLVVHVPFKALKLAKCFWPGPLTMVLKKSDLVPDEVTCGLDTVAVRMPSHKIAHTLIKAAGVPIAAPSANLSGKPSTTTAKHAIHDLKGKVDAIIDGGDATIGLESTVIDLTSKPAVLLRPGGITREEIEEVLGLIKLHPSLKGKLLSLKGKVKSPGMKYRHYAPKARVILVEGEPEKVRAKISELALKFKREKKKVGILYCSKKAFYPADSLKFAGASHKAVARDLFKNFRAFDRENIQIIIAEAVSEKGIGLAIMNRMKRAAYRIVKAG
ncbi:MAG: L-threonylcarbamoyladenylate synthase [Candidatus Diapherotrites archaeon]